jgi:hypothetical protein
MIADCILGADCLDKFQVIISLKDQCKYTNDENGSNRCQFVSAEKSAAEMKDETPICEIRKSTIVGEESESSCRIEGKGDRSLRILASDMAHDKHKFTIKEHNRDSVDKSREFMHNRTICASPSTCAVGTGAIQK